MIGEKYKVGVEIDANTMGLKRGTQEAERHLSRLKNVPQGLESTFKRLGGAMLSVTKYMAIAGGIATAGILKSGTKLALTTEKNIAKFRQLGASQKDQAKIMSKLGQVSKQYGVAMADLTGASVQFYAAGIKDSDKIKNKMKLIADASLFAGKSFEEMGFLLGKSLSSGYLDLTEFWQLNNAGIITLQDLIGKLGNNIEEVMDEVSKRHLTSEIAEKIIREKTAEFERMAQINVGVAMQYFQNSYRKAQEEFSRSLFKAVLKGKNPAKDIYDFSKRLPGIFSKMGAAIGNLLRDLAPLGGILKEVLKVIWDITKSAVDLIKVIFKSNAIAPILEALKMVGGVVIDIIDMVANSTLFDGIKDGLDGLLSILDPIIDCVKMILWAIQPIIPIIGNILTMLKPVLQVIGFLLKVLLIPVVAVISGIVRLIMNIVKWITDVNRRVSQIISGFFVWLGKTIAMTKPWKTLVKWAKAFGNAVKSAYNWVAKMANKLYNLAASPFRKITNFFRGRYAGTNGFLSYYNRVRGYADGGIVRVNERGGELIGLPNGSVVVPHDYTNKILNTRKELNYEIIENIFDKVIGTQTEKIIKSLLKINVNVGNIKNGTLFKI